MGLQMSGIPRVPIFNGTAAEMAAMITMLEGDIFYTTDTKKVYTYDGVAWNDVLGGITSSWEILKTDIRATDGVLDTGAGGVATGYKYLRLIFNVKAKTTAGSALRLIFNNDSGNEYNWVRLMTSGAAVTTDNASNQPYFHLGNMTTTIDTIGVIDIINVTANDKIMLSFKGYPSEICYTYGKYHGAAAEISRVKLENNSDTDLAVGSSYLLLGCKGS